jgi:hypothetical protein
MSPVAQALARVSPRAAPSVGAGIHPLDIEDARAHEREADEFGWRLMLGPLASAEHPNRLQVAVAGASLTLQVLAALDDLALVRDGRAQEDAVHPGTYPFVP